ncbi:unnamed protein product [Closterium sp. NIES-64]|nr:unnamed protein product [Closterium sp. NIES-64]
MSNCPFSMRPHLPQGVEDAFPAMAVPSQLTSPLLAANGGSSPPPAAAESTPPTSAAVWTAAALPFLFPALGGVLFGYDIGATSSALLSLKDPVLSGTDWFDLSSTAVGLVVSGSLGGALLGCLLAFRIADPLGPTASLALTSPPPLSLNPPPAAAPPPPPSSPPHAHRHRVRRRAEEGAGAGGGALLYRSAAHSLRHLPACAAGWPCMRRPCT